MTDEHIARRRERQAPSLPHEELSAERILKLAKPQAQGRGREGQGLGCLREASGAREREKDAEIGEVVADHDDKA